MSSFGERIASIGLFTALWVVCLKTLMIFFGFQHTVIFALAVITILALDSQR